MSDPLIRKNYGSIPHLPGSRIGEGDHHISESQAKVLIDKPRDYKDLVIVQEKLDGANVGIYRDLDGRLIGLTRGGNIARSSPMEQFQLFQDWIDKNSFWFNFICVGERLIGEWIAMAHGTKYKTSCPFIAFDMMIEDKRMTYLDFRDRVSGRVPIAPLLHIGQPISIKKIEKILDKKIGETYGYAGALEPVEGAVWRVEREGKVDFLAKFVRHCKEDGKYFNEDHTKLVWNWRPEKRI